MARSGKIFIRFLVMLWSRIRGVPKTQRFTVLFAVLVTASALRARSAAATKKGTKTKQLSRVIRRRNSLNASLVSSKTPDSDTFPISAQKTSTAAITAAITTNTTPKTASANTTTSIATTIVNSQHSLLDGLTGVGAWVESMYHAIVNKVLVVRQRTGTTVVGALSATKNFFENTKHAVQTKAADAITKTALQNIEPMLDMISLQVKRRIKDKDMPRFVLRMIDDTVDAVMPDIKEEFHRRTLEVRDTYLSPALTIRKRRKKSSVGRRGGGDRRLRAPSSRFTFSYDENPSNTPIEQMQFVRRHLSYGADNDGGRNSGSSNNRGYMIGPPPVPHALKLSICTRSWRLFLYQFIRFGHRVRSFVLYTMHPYDRTIWSQVKNYKWIACTSLGLIPIVGQLFWLFVFLIKNKRDEYQVIDFIVGFQVARFLAQGLFFFLYGCGLYYKCVNFHGDCSIDGPSLSIWGACYFLMQIILVWSAFLMLPFTSRPSMTPEVRQAHAIGRVICVDQPRLRGNGCLGGFAPRRSIAMSPSPRRRSSFNTPAATAVAATAVKMLPGSPSSSNVSLYQSQQRIQRQSVTDDDHIVYIYDDDGKLVKDMTVDGRAWSDRIRLETQRGGHLIKLFWYSTLITTIASVCVVTSLLTISGWRLRGTLFWIRTIYCLLLCPFVIFKVPMMMRLLTRARQTGYDTEGRTCVQHKKIKYDDDRNKSGVIDRGISSTFSIKKETGRLSLLKKSLGLTIDTNHVESSLARKTFNPPKKNRQTKITTPIRRF